MAAGLTARSVTGRAGRRNSLGDDAFYQLLLLLLPFADRRDGGGGGNGNRRENEKILFVRDDGSARFAIDDPRTLASVSLIAGPCDENRRPCRRRLFGLFFFFKTVFSLRPPSFALPLSPFGAISERDEIRNAAATAIPRATRGCCVCVRRAAAARASTS